MARAGFFRRIFNAVRNVLAAPPEPTPPPEREPSRDLDDRYREAWREETRSRTGRRYERHRELFDSIPGITDEDDDEQEFLWRSYLDNMVSGRHRRNDPNNPFWSDIGIDPRDFDWQEFRTAMGYKSRAK